ncbi:MAG: urease accessory protein UreE [Gemmataceae bacterium]
MILVEKILGNLNEEPWKSRLNGASLDRLELDQWSAQKNRFRKTSRDGTELAIALDRGSHLRDGDILVWDEAKSSAIVIHLNLQDVLVIQMKELLGQSQEVLARTCFELGHALGNQHWPAVVKGTTVYVPLTVDRKVMASVMKTHAFAGITHEFRTGLEIIPYLAPHEARRLFGGADATPHTHLHGHSHGSGSHTHTHTHADGTTHTHEHAHEPGHDHGHHHSH